MKISSHLKYRIRPDLRDNENITENCFIEVLTKNGNIIVGSLYRPPYTNETEFLTLIENTLATSKNEKKELILGMDHNLDLFKYHRHNATEIFLDSLIEHECLPTITRPTRITKTTATQLDNIFISKGLFGNSRSCIALTDESDHLPCFVRICNILPGLKQPLLAILNNAI